MRNEDDLGALSRLRSRPWSKIPGGLNEAGRNAEDFARAIWKRR